MTRLILFSKVLIVILSFILVLSLIRIKPDSVIFGFSGCAPELIQVKNNEIKIDTNYYFLDKQSTEHVKLGGCQFNSKQNDFNQFKLKIPLIMIIDFRNHIGGPNSFGRYYFLEFKVLGIKRQFVVSEPKKSIYFADLDKRVSDKMRDISLCFGDSCFIKARFLGCD